MRILVTGDNGFIGSHLANTLKKDGHEVIGLDLKHGQKDYQTVDFDITKPMTHLSNADVIFHLAADVECKNKRQGYKINVEGTKNILEIAKNLSVKSFIYISTGGVYGFGDKPFKETDKVAPHNFYSMTKYKAELLSKAYSKYFPVVVIRYFFPYSSDGNTRLINRLVNQIRNSEMIELNASGKPIINPIYIDDAIEATIKLMKPQKNFNIFNIGGAENTGILDIIRIIEKELGIKANIRFNKKKIGNMIGDVTKAKKLLKFKPKTGIKQGIKLVCQSDV